MIWHEEQITVEKQPPNQLLKLVGVYNPPHLMPEPAIVIRLTLEPTPSDDIISPLHYRSIQLFTKDISLGGEDPDPELIRDKFRPQLGRIRARLLRQTFDEINSLFVAK